MLTSKKGIILLLVVMIGFVYGIWQYHQTEEENLRKPTTAEAEAPEAKKDCEVKKDTAIAAETVMKGVLNPGASYDVLTNYYACNPVESGEVVYYRFSKNFSPVPRIVRGVPGDRFKVIKDESGKSWNLQINGEILQYQDKPYFFGTEEPPVLALYEKTFNGVLPKNAYLLLSYVPPGEVDSANLGLMSLSDLVGKVDVPKVTGKTPSRKSNRL